MNDQYRPSGQSHAATEGEGPRPTAWQRALSRAGLAVHRGLDAAGTVPLFGPLLLLILPFVVLVALSADLLAFLFGGVGRAAVSWTLLFVVGGVVLGVVVGGDAVLVMPLMMGVAGLLLGLVLGFLCGRIFRHLPEFFDRAQRER